MNTKGGLELDADVALASLATALLERPPETYLSVTRRALEVARALVDRLKNDAASPQETLARWDDVNLLLSEASSLASVCRNCHPDSKLRDTADTAEQEIEALSVELQLDRGIYDALMEAQRQVEKDPAALDPAGRHYLNKTLRGMRRSGVDRDEATRRKVKQLRDELLVVEQEFGKNIIEDVRHIDLDPAQLDGLPADYVATHPVSPAAQPGKDGKVRITTDSTDYVPFITYAKSASAREALWRAHRQRAREKNLPMLDRLLRGRWQLAQLLGYSSYAALVTEDKMIGDEKKAAAFIEEIATSSAARERREYEELLAQKRKETPDASAVDPWDAAYLSDRLSKEKANYSAQEIRPYLEYTRVERGVLATMSRLFGVRFEPATQAYVLAGRWHEQVDLYEVVDETSGRPLGRIYLDMHPREGKYKHYAQFTVRTGVHRPGRERLPEGALVCNFPDPKKGLALLELDQVRTLFHEFGHLMHHLLGGHTRWAGVSGVATEWDFVEAPSQLLEEWAWDWDTVAAFATHHETGEPLPRALLDKARVADGIGKGLWVRQQMFYAALSLEYHRRDPSTFDTTALLAELQTRYTPYRYVEGNSFQASFGHLAGYSAIYYTYMWSLVIAKDLFSMFSRAGLRDVAPARKYREEVLAPGGGQPAAELCEKFLGRPYNVAAYRTWLDASS